MSATSKTHLLSQIDKNHQKYKQMSQINAILDDDCHLNKTQKINALVEIARQLLNEQKKVDQINKQQQQNIVNLQSELSAKNQMIEKYRSQLLQNQNQYFVLQNQLKHTNNQLKSTQAQLLVQQELINHDKMVSARKVLSMQNQVNYLLHKDCQQSIKKSHSKNLTSLYSSNNNENINIQKKCKGKKGHVLRKSTLKC